MVRHSTLTAVHAGSTPAASVSNGSLCSAKHEDKYPKLIPHTLPSSKTRFKSLPLGFTRSHLFFLSVFIVATYAIGHTPALWWWVQIHSGNLVLRYVCGGRNIHWRNAKIRRVPTAQPLADIQWGKNITKDIWFSFELKKFSVHGSPAIKVGLRIAEWRSGHLAWLIPKRTAVQIRPLLFLEGG